MKRAAPQNPYRAAIQRFNRAGVRYVVVGMSGINHYAKNAAEAFGTMDYDFFVEPTLENVGKAIHCLQDLRFDIGTSTGAWKEAELRWVVRDKRTVLAATPGGFMIELLLEISGYPFSEMAEDAATFSMGGVLVKVGRLNKLLRSKKIAGRPKDRRFLRRYQDLLEEE